MALENINIGEIDRELKLVKIAWHKSISIDKENNIILPRHNFWSVNEVVPVPFSKNLRGQLMIWSIEPININISRDCVFRAKVSVVPDVVKLIINGHVQHQPLIGPELLSGGVVGRKYTVLNTSYVFMNHEMGSMSIF